MPLLFLVFNKYLVYTNVYVYTCSFMCVYSEKNNMGFLLVLGDAKGGASSKPQLIQGQVLVCQHFNFISNIIGGDG